MSHTAATARKSRNQYIPRSLTGLWASPTPAVRLGGQRCRNVMVKRCVPEQFGAAPRWYDVVQQAPERASAGFRAGSARVRGTDGADRGRGPTGAARAAATPRGGVAGRGARRGQRV